MALLNGILALVIFIWLASTNIQASRIDAITGYDLEFPKHNSHQSILFPLSNKVFGNEAYAYAFCTNPNRHSPKTRNCDVNLMHFDNKGVASNKTCNVNVSHEEGIKSDMTFHVHSINNDRVILVHPIVEEPGEEANISSTVNARLWIRVLHMDSCEMYEAMLSTELPIRNLFLGLRNFEQLDIIHHEDHTFDVFFPNGPCKGARCKYTFNDKAEQIKGPLDILPSEDKNSIIRLYPFESSDAYFAFVTDVILPENIREIPRTAVALRKLLYVKDNVVNVVKNFSLNINFHDYLYDSDTGLFADQSNDLFGFCRQYTVNGISSVDCLQFDKGAIIKLNMTFNLNDSRKILAMHNVPKGLILVEATCTKSSCSGFSIRKVASNDSVDINDLNINGTISVLQVTAGMVGDQFCISMYAASNQKEGTLTLKKRCLPEKSITFLDAQTN